MFRVDPRLIKTEAIEPTRFSWATTTPRKKQELFHLAKRTGVRKSSLQLSSFPNCNLVMLCCSRINCSSLEECQFCYLGCWQTNIFSRVTEFLDKILPQFYIQTLTEQLTQPLVFFSFLVKIKQSFMFDEILMIFYIIIYHTT